MAMSICPSRYPRPDAVLGEADLPEIFISKGYPIDLPLQTKLAAESSIINVIFDRKIVATARPDHVQRVLTMNSVAGHAVTN
jgi:hypothetical protein